MKKKLFSVLISFIMLLTSLVSVTTSAEETINILETYKFEEFLALSEEEMCAISDEVAEAYAHYEQFSSYEESIFILHVLIDESYKESDMAELFMYPDDMIHGEYGLGENFIVDGDEATRVLDCVFNFERYLTNSGNYYDSHLRTAIVLWFSLNPVSLICTIETNLFESKLGDIDQDGQLT